MNKTVIAVVIVAVVVLGGYFILRGNYRTPTSNSVQTQTPVKTSPETQAPISQVKEISVAGTEFSFNPASISVKAGERVKITFKNNGKFSHNLTLERLGVATKTIRGGQTDVIEFVAPTAGTYAFFCSVPGHRASGMEGNLKVE